jgi:hypothetical protein
MPPTLHQRARVCYLNDKVREDFERLPLLPTERKLVKKVWTTLPAGRHALQYPADDSSIGEQRFVFRVSVASTHVVLTEVETFKPDQKPLWRRFGHRLLTAMRWIGSLWILMVGRDSVDGI